jgi:hypothetical protein
MAPLDSIQKFLRGRPSGQPGELPGKILLQRLPPPLRPLQECRVNVFRNATYEKVCHAFIMIALLKSTDRLVSRKVEAL